MLYSILSNRESVNLLKYLSENKSVLKYSNLSYSETSLLLLEKAGLVYVERTDDLYVTISVKGQNFIRITDELKSLIDLNKKSPRKILVDYSLTDREKSLLLGISRSLFEYKIKSLFKDLNKEKIYFKEKDFNKDLAILDDLNMIKTSRGKVLLTDLGRRVLKNELLKKYNLLD